MEQKIRAIAIVERGNEVLLVKRKKEADPSIGGYVFMGTKVEAGETPEQALKNEYIKNTGIEIIVGNLIAEKLSKYKRTMWYEAQPSNKEQKPIAITDLEDACYVLKLGILTYITDPSSLKGIPKEVALKLKIIKP